MGSLKARSPVIVVLGATATGKTSVALELARRLDGEIISADSRAFFTGLDIVTDKPTPEQRRSIPHHLIDCVPIDGVYDAMAFRSDVSRLLPQIRQRRHQPIIAGGGTLYLAALLRGLFEGPDKDDDVRGILQTCDIDDLYDELIAVDPQAARRIHRNDRLRITRAIEVFRTTGKPMSQWQAEAVSLPEDFYVIGLLCERASHRCLIEARVRQMLACGVIEEIAQLRSKGLTEQSQAYRTIGVPEAFEVLEKTMTLEAFVQRVSERTWQLARRQMTWFRRDKDVHWIDVTGRTADEVAEQILAGFSPGLAAVNEDT